MTWSDVLSQIQSTLNSWLETFVSALPNLAVAIVVVLAGAGLAKLVHKLALEALQRAGMAQSARRVVAKLAYTAVIIGATIVALGVLDLQQTVTSILAGAGVVGLAVGLAFQDIASNLLAGLSMSFRKPFRIGDLIETNGMTGHVVQVDLRTTRIETLDGHDVLIPNNDIYSNAIRNFTNQNKQRVDVEVGVSYADDLELARDTTLSVLNELECRLDNREPEVYFVEFGGSSINLVGRFWIHSGSRKELFEARSEAIMGIKDAYDREGLTIPFPIRTMDFGIAGGKDLSSMLLTHEEEQDESRELRH